MKKVAIVFTGGTIAMRRDASGLVVPALSGSELLAAVPELSSIACLEAIEFDRIPGPHMTPRRMMDLSAQLSELLGRPDIDGAVVTHGTDSLEETAFLVDLTLISDKPVVFAGAMKNISDPGWDGPVNLLAAVATAAAPEASGRGVMVVMNNEIHAASQVTKTNTHTLDTFKSKDFGPIGYIDGDGVRARFYYDYTRREQILTSVAEPRVDLFKAACGMDDRLLRYAVDSGARGIVIEGMGRGNLPPDMMPGIAHAVKNHVPVVLCSRCLMGRVLDSYGYPGAGKELVSMGVIRAGNLPGQKARIKLMLALGAGYSYEQILNCFEGQEYH